MSKTFNNHSEVSLIRYILILFDIVIIILVMWFVHSCWRLLLYLSDLQSANLKVYFQFLGDICYNDDRNSSLMFGL